MADTLTNAWVARIVDAARVLVEAHERRAVGHEVPTLAERTAVSVLLYECIGNRAKVKVGA